MNDRDRLIELLDNPQKSIWLPPWVRKEVRRLIAENVVLVNEVVRLRQDPTKAEKRG
jgi:hypothetical protein